MEFRLALLTVSSANKTHDQSSKKKKKMMCKLAVHIVLCPNSGWGGGGGPFDDFISKDSVAQYFSSLGYWEWH